MTVAAELAALRAKLAARRGKAEYAESVREIETRIAAMEGK